MHLNFCTLFNSAYLSRGIALYESLLKNTPDFHLYIFAFDNQAYEILVQLGLQKATIISLNEFEHDKLLRVKQDRSLGEYCWTCTSSTILYCLNRFSLDHCTYLDADLYFFSSPEPLIKEVGENSVLITEHRYTPEYNQSEISGKYCVQFMFFKNDERGKACLEWWVDECIKWCYAKPEDGKFGDQKYLDDWLNRFEGVHELQHLGGGVAPWNVQQYDLFLDNGRLKGKEILSDRTFEIVFYHFHKLTYLQDGMVDFGDYKLRDQELNLLYKPYLKHLDEIKNKILAAHQMDPHGTRKDSGLIRKNFRILKQRVKGTLNRHKLQDILDNAYGQNN